MRCRGVVARIEKVVAGVGGHREVVVLAAAVDSSKWFFVKQADEAILLGGLLHEVHDQHVVVRGKVRVLEEWSNFILTRCDFVVPGLHRNAELEHSSASVSDMQARTRSGIVPKY